MKSSMGRVVFREFLKCEYSEENILFWLACEDLKKDNNPEVVEEKARLIYEDYISILSPKEVLFTSYILWRYTPLYCVCICASSCGFEFIKSTTSPNGLFRPLFTGLHAYTICEETNSIRYSPLCCAILTYFIRRFHLTALRTRRTEPIRVSVYESSSRRSIVKMPNVWCITPLLFSFDFNSTVLFRNEMARTEMSRWTTEKSDIVKNDLANHLTVCLF